MEAFFICLFLLLCIGVGLFLLSNSLDKKVGDAAFIRTKRHRDSTPEEVDYSVSVRANPSRSRSYCREDNGGIVDTVIDTAVDYAAYSAIESVFSDEDDE